MSKPERPEVIRLTVHFPDGNFGTISGEKPRHLGPSFLGFLAPYQPQAKRRSAIRMELPLVHRG